ncbi:RNA polymerase sigma-70 factor [Natronosporangium hydrolyticum]|uniref:RNA polymerase sigma-70 factor n=1 Tax=Natronosporangium hydrolyticum TaxID=2811111 RepID=A0A895YL08_9ACTN|nr:RNA polymerase sigma-70 factor [Natronosporangium hydrolyticum]QSB16665.1 RNA polymerase sigma-70 factor [Natronosporangium hydrolyticum]
MTDPHTAEFTAQRDLLFGVAYRILGEVAGAEDMVQNTWLRWREVDLAQVANPTGFLVRAVTNLAVDELRSARVRRESYVGSWLPEPILTSPDDPAEQATHADTISLGLLVVLETLSPLERAVFVLREAFAYRYAEIGELLGRSEETVRKLGHRARSHVQARRPRFDLDRGQHREVTQRFLAAASDGDLDGLLAMLAPQVALTSDSGGRERAPLRVITGAEKVGRFLVGIGRHPRPGTELRLIEVNGAPAALAVAQGRPYALFALEVAEGQIAAIQLIVNPEKLHGLTHQNMV